MNGEYMNVSIDTYKNGCIYTHNAVVSKDTYDYDWDALIRGEEVPCEWDEEGNPIAWDSLSEEE